LEMSPDVSLESVHAVETRLAAAIRSLCPELADVLTRTTV
jgi:divalent metal cation (Fe/Co/Zn/Cd) transporter